ncbi:hypothetical protein AOQ73_25375 [Bradyrhizobium pachyrhizi]|nr:hypothetical protein AOQ73_25375 [Bradyrhizobium pachyrhizi]
MEDSFTFEGLQVDFPIMKFRRQVENIGAVLLSFEKKFKLPIRFSRINSISPERLVKSWARGRIEAAHRLPQLKLQHERRSGSFKADVKA